MVKKGRKKLKTGPTVKKPSENTKRVKRGLHLNGHHLLTVVWRGGRQETEAMRGKTG